MCYNNIHNNIEYIVKEIIAKEMELPVDEISVNFIQTDMADDRFDTRPRYEVTSINIIHKQK